MMNRRTFIKISALSGAAFGARKASAYNASATPQIAVTMDDFNVFDTPSLTSAARNRAILDALHARRLKIALFV